MGSGKYRNQICPSCGRKYKNCGHPHPEEVRSFAPEVRSFAPAPVSPTGEPSINREEIEGLVLPHEAGHAIVANHVRLRVTALTVEVLRDSRGLGIGNFAAQIVLPNPGTILQEDEPENIRMASCLAIAGGAAATQMLHGTIGDEGALKDDRYKLRHFTEHPLETFLPTAIEILKAPYYRPVIETIVGMCKQRYRDLFHRITAPGARVPFGTQLVTLVTEEELDALWTNADFPVKRRKTAELWKLYFDRETSPGYAQPFWGCDTPITREEIKAALEAGIFEPATGHCTQGDRPCHIRRIAGIVAAIQKGVEFSPIWLRKAEAAELFPDTPNDGCHRLTACWYLNTDWVVISYEDPNQAEAELIIL